jgi:NAD+ kinase
MHSVGLVLHPQRDSAEAVRAVLGWATHQEITVFGIEDEIRRLNCAVVPVTAEELGRCCDLVVSLGGDGTMLRAMRLADRQRAPVLGVNLGKLGFLAEVDVPDLPGALSAIDSKQFTIEPRLDYPDQEGKRTSGQVQPAAQHDEQECEQRHQGRGQRPGRPAGPGWSNALRGT